MKKGLPHSLRDKQELIKLETIHKVESAIELLESQEAKVTRKAIMDLTGLSSATLSKEHVKLLFKQKKVCQFASNKRISASNHTTSKDKDLEIYRLNEKVLRLENTIIKKDIRLDSLKKEYSDLENKYELLIGKIHELTKKLEYLK